MFSMLFDPLFITLVLPAFIFALLTQFKVVRRFKKYSKYRTKIGMTGAQAAKVILLKSGIKDVQIEKVEGDLTDHFDPRTNTIYLSESVHDVVTISAVGVAAHEAGHAIQYAKSYTPMKIRAGIIPVTNIGSKLSVPLIIIGIIFGMAGLVNIGILLFGTVVLFQLVTLPVEYNASKLAINALRNHGLLRREEIPAARRVLSAAALTYVGALAISLAQLIRLLALTQE